MIPSLISKSRRRFRLRKRKTIVQAKMTEASIRNTDQNTRALQGEATSPSSNAVDVFIIKDSLAELLEEQPATPKFGIVTSTSGISKLYWHIGTNNATVDEDWQILNRLEDDDLA